MLILQNKGKTSLDNTSSLYTSLMGISQYFVICNKFYWTGINNWVCHCFHLTLLKQRKERNLRSFLTAKLKSWAKIENCRKLFACLLSAVYFQRMERNCFKLKLGNDDWEQDISQNTNLHFCGIDLQDFVIQTNGCENMNLVYNRIQLIITRIFLKMTRLLGVDNCKFSIIY